MKLSNIHKHLITTIIGVIFLISTIAYAFLVDEPSEYVIKPFIAVGLLLLFLSDEQIKSVINKVLDKKI